MGCLTRSVFKALDLSVSPPRPVALKRFFPRKTDGISISSLKEIDHLRQARSPQVVPLRDVAFKDEDGVCYIVLVFDYLPHDLLGVARRGVRFTPRCVRSLFREIVRGVADLHAQGLVHRDIKSNVISCKHFVEQRAKGGRR